MFRLPKLSSGLSNVLAFALPLAITVILSIEPISMWAANIFDPLPGLVAYAICMIVLFAPSYAIISLMDLPRRDRVKVAILMSIGAVPYSFILFAISFVIGCSQGNCL